MIRVSQGCRNGVKGCRKGVERVSKNMYIRTILNNYHKTATYMYKIVNKWLLISTLATPLRHPFDTFSTPPFCKILIKLMSNSVGYRVIVIICLLISTPCHFLAPFKKNKNKYTLLGVEKYHCLISDTIEVVFISPVRAYIFDIYRTHA